MSLLCLWSAVKKVEEQLGKKAKKKSRKKSGKKSRKKSREEKSSTQFAWHLPGSVQTLRRVLRGVFTWEKSLRREFHTGMTFWFRITFTRWLGHFEGTLHVEIYNRKHHACATRSSLPADRFHPGMGGRFASVHDIVAKSRTGVKFSPRCGNRGELAPGRLAPAWHFVVVSCKQMSSDRREPEWTRPGAKVAPVLCKTPTGFRS